MKPAETYCPFSRSNCQKNCALYDAHFEECMFAVALSGVGAYSTVMLMQDLDTVDSANPKMRLFKAVAEATTRAVGHVVAEQARAAEEGHE